MGDALTAANLTGPMGASGSSSFAQKVIQAAITLVPNAQTGQPTTFAGTGSSSVTLSGYRTRVRISNAGGINNSASVTIYGLSQSIMNQLSTLGQIFNMTQRNSIVISAGDLGGAMTPVFSGIITQAFGYYNDLPNAAMQMECRFGQYEGVQSAAPASFAQSTSVATVIGGMAGQAGWGFENNGVSTQLPPSYFPGTIRDQIRAAAEHAYVNAEPVVGSGGQATIAIWPMGGYRTSLGGGAPLISKDTGMILTPAFAPNGFASVRSLFNPQVNFGGLIQVVSSAVPQASKAWVVQRLSMALDCYVPKGKWEMGMICYPNGFQAPIPPTAASQP